MTSNLSGADRKNLTPHQQNQIANYKHQWQVAQAAGNTSGMEAAHAAAEAIRYYGGRVAGLCSIFSTVSECAGHTVRSVFDTNDLGAYRMALTIEPVLKEILEKRYSK